MATERIDIVVTKTGDKEAAQGIADIGTQAEKSAKQVDVVSSSLGFLKSALGALGIGLTVNYIKQLTDSYSGMISRLKLVSTSQAELVKTEQALFDISQRTRGSFEASADLYSKLALQAGNLGVETKDLLPAIESINQAIAISGVSGETAKAGLLQFSQGLASNRFQGDELRSVLENIPTLGIAIAKGLGTTTAGLRKMGEQGQLSAKLVLDALAKSAPELAAQFGKITPTIGGAIQTLQNAVLRFVGTLDQVNGASALVAQSIQFIANNLSTLIGVVEVALIAFAAFKAAVLIQPVLASFAAGVTAANIALQTYVATSAAAGVQTTVWSRLLVALGGPISSVTSLIRGLWAVIAANPFVAIATAIAAAVALVYVFGNSINITSSGSITLLGALLGAWNLVKEAIQSVWAFLMQYLTPVWNVVSNAAAVAIDYIVKGIQFLLSVLATLFDTFKGASEAFGSFGGKVKKAMEDATASLKQGGLASKDFGDAFKKAGDQSSAAADGMKLKIPPALETVHNASAQMRDGLVSDQEAVRNAFGETITGLDEWAVRAGAAFNKVAQASSQATSSVASDMGSMSGVASGGFGGSSGLGGGTTSGTFTSTFRDSTIGINARSGSFGNAGLRLALNNALTSANLFQGGAAGPGAIKGVYNVLAQDPNAARAWLSIPQNQYLKSQFEQQGLPGFRTGGSFDVGGRGGPDSQLVQFMATPGETVNVQTPQQRRGESGQGSPSQRPIVVTMQINTPDAGSFRRSENQIITQLGGKLQSALGGL